METSSAMGLLFCVIFAQVDSPFVGGKVTNVIYDSSIEKVGGQFVCEISNSMVFPSNLKAWDAIIIAFDFKNYDVIMNQSLNDFKNNVKITFLGTPKNLEELDGYSVERYKEH